MTEVTEQDLREHAAEVEGTEEEPLSANATRPGVARSKMLHVRLNPDEYDAIVALAGERGLPVSTLARGALLTQLNVDRPTLSIAVQRLTNQVEELRRLVDQKQVEDRKAS